MMMTVIMVKTLLSMNTKRTRTYRGGGAQEENAKQRHVKTRNASGSEFKKTAKEMRRIEGKERWRRGCVRGREVPAVVAAGRQTRRSEKGERECKGRRRRGQK